MSVSLSERQADCLAAIEAHIRKHGVPPTLRELGNMLGITSTNGVRDHLVALDRKGFIKLNRDGKSRGIRLPDLEPVSVRHDTNTVALLASEAEAALGVRFTAATRLNVEARFRRLLTVRAA